MIPECNLPLTMDTNSNARPQGEPQPAVEGHENTDARARGIFIFMVLLFISMFGMQWLLRGVLAGLNKAPPPTDAWSQAPRAVRPPLKQPPPFPRLQLSPPADLAYFRAQEETQLHSYGW